MSDTCTLLVVEDDAIIRMLVVDVLEEFEYTVLQAEDGAAALVFLNDPALGIDLMITDVGLPGMDGKQLAARAHEIRPRMPILFASGSADIFEIPPGTHMIGKPFSIDQLRDKVTSILQR